MKEKYAYCLLHKRWYTKETIKPKCFTSNKKKPQKCKYLIVIKEESNK